MPALGMAQETGKLVRWLKNDGEQVAKGEPLMEVETDKATVEVESPASGKLAAIAAGAGDDIAVGRTIALILGPGEAVPASLPKVVALRPEATPSPTISTIAPPVADPGGRAGASPKARRLAEERGIDISKLVGSGPDGAIVEEDVLAAVGGGAASAVTEPALWQAMAENVTRSWKEAPHFFVIREVDASGLVEERARLAADVTYTDFVLRAVAAALAEHPRMNRNSREVNIGLAVAVPDGLLVPVIHGIDRLPVEEIAARRQELVKRVRAGRMRSSDVSGGTFTVSNLGMYGVDLFTAILTEGQAGILALGRIAERVAARDGTAVVRPTLLMSLSCDHRRVDGARAAEFMQTLVGLIEKPA
jgi:pyruvate dehydrogenase E2 component (dihydrolipoamide acetyltransferase)